MAKTTLRGLQVTDNSIQRDDLDYSTVGQAVIRKLVQGTNISLSSTGGDAGTGDVTVSLNTSNIPLLDTANVFTALNTLTNLKLSTGKIYPSSNSTTALQITKADGTTAIGTWDTTNSRLGIGTTNPQVQLHIDDASGAGTRLSRTTATATVGNNLGQINGFNGSTRVGIIQFSADGATNSGAIEFWTTPSGGGVAQRMIISSSGLVTLTNNLTVSGGTITLGSQTLLQGNVALLDAANVFTNTGRILRLGLGVAADATRQLTIIGTNNYPVKITGSSGGGFYLGAYDASFGGFWSAGVTPATSNYALLASSTDTVLNAPTGAIYFSIGDVAKARLFASGGFNLGGATDPGAGNLTVSGGTATIGLGGTTSAFPALKRSSTILQARLADDSAYTDIEVLDEAYGGGWNGSLEVPTKNALYDKIETLGSTTSAFSIKTANYTAVVGDRIAADTLGGVFTITLPASPSIGDSIVISDATNYWATNNLTIARNGNNIQGSATNLTANVDGKLITLVYISTAFGWSVIN